jgi:hypothetical protein
MHPFHDGWGIPKVVRRQPDLLSLRAVRARGVHADVTLGLGRLGELVLAFWRRGSWSWRSTKTFKATTREDLGTDRIPQGLPLFRRDLEKRLPLRGCRGPGVTDKPRRTGRLFLVEVLLGDELHQVLEPTIKAWNRTATTDLELRTRDGAGLHGSIRERLGRICGSVLAIEILHARRATTLETCGCGGRREGVGREVPGLVVELSRATLRLHCQEELK